ncbi:hypothetical protein ACQ4M3_05615 [Leptolyngbya sp. AN03gr2]|uniref:hypothetical protein n=1 Tax=unclassified Leptolyngbya TaxID=2650499 RepID=UPI003D31EB51
MKRFWTLGGGLSLSTLALLFYALGPGSEQLQTKQAVPAQIEAVYEDAIAQAEQAAKRQQFDRAIEIADGIPTNSRHSQTAQQLRESWSQALLQQANAEYRKGNVQAAIAKLQPISQFNPLASQAASLRTTWRTEAQQLDQVTKAIAAKNWTQALQAIEPLRGTELFNTPRVQALFNQAITNAFNTTAVAQLSAPPPITNSITPVPIQITQPAAPTITPPTLRAVAIPAEGALEASVPRSSATVATAPIPVPSLPVPNSSSTTLPPPPAPISVATSNSPSSPIPSRAATTASSQAESSTSTPVESQQPAIESPEVVTQTAPSGNEAPSPQAAITPTVSTERDSVETKPPVQSVPIPVPSPQQSIAQGNTDRTQPELERLQLNQASPSTSAIPTTSSKPTTPANPEEIVPEETVVVADLLNAEALNKVTEVVRKQEAVALGTAN